MLSLREIFASPQKYAGQISVCGWVRTVREGKAFGFVELNDGTSFKPVQVVYPNDERNLGKELTTGCAICVVGNLLMTPDAPQPFEIHADDIILEGACPSDYPMQKKRHSLEFLRTMQTLRPRTNTFLATFRVRSVVAAAIHEFFQQRGFVYVHTPILTNADCEGRGEMFQVTTLDLDNIPRTQDGKIDYNEDFFKKEVHLAGTGQMYGEAFALAFRDIYTFGPTFRAEYSFTARHAAEFWMIEPEMAFCDLAKDMDVAEAMVKYIINTVLDRCPQEMEFFNNFIDKGLLSRLDNVLLNDFERVSYTKAVEILQSCGEKFEYPVEWGIDLQSEHERYLTEKVFGKPIFVTDYPIAIKAFYMRQNDDGKTVAAADLLVPGVGEIVGGSQREERYDVLKARCDELGMDMSEYQWYLDLRKYGGVKHAGFGLGFERMVMYLTGMSNIRDVVPFPRTTANLEM
ncbi:MAG: asparagine--tRNA ligase [Eubacteriales bacterium]|nr:asparagine--tRNA ligase [Eubacteriales bacterium]